jgi:hypothetical protein
MLQSSVNEGVSDQWVRHAAWALVLGLFSPFSSEPVLSFFLVIFLFFLNHHVTVECR